MGDWEAWSGVKIVSIVFGFIGAALGISYTPIMTKKSAFAALLSGLVCGALGPEFVSWAFSWKLPPLINNVFAFIFGIGGMYIVPGIITAWKGFATDPWAFIDRIRGVVKKDQK